MSRYLRVFAAVLAAVVLLAGCGRIADNRKFLHGIGTDLNTSDLGEQTRILQIYFGHICAQAGLTIGNDADGIPKCNYAKFADSTAYWNVFVVQGMNDVDRRCDAYLAWLDDKRRSRESKLRQITDIRTATVAIMSFTGSGTTPMDVVGLAFGLLTDTVGNYHSRLLLEMEGSTVQAVVFRERARLRSEINSIDFASKPDAYHAIRSYLNICLPHTIETEINNTITVDKRAPDSETKPLISATTRFTSRSRFVPPGRATSTDEEAKKIFRFPKGFFRADVEDMQRRICAKPDGIVGPGTKEAIYAVEDLIYSGDVSKFDGFLNNTELQSINGYIPSVCNYTSFNSRFELIISRNPDFKQKIVAALNILVPSANLDVNMKIESERFRNSIITANTVEGMNKHPQIRSDTITRTFYVNALKLGR